MKLAILPLLVLAACTPAQDDAITKGLASQPGRLFCSIQMSGGGAFVATLTAVAITGASPGAAPLAVIATNAGKAAVDADCAKAALATPGALSAAPVSPPPNAASVPSVAIVAPASPVVAASPAAPAK